MKQILVPDVKEALIGTPRPHYLVGKGAMRLLEKNKIEFTGNALFPLSDVSIADREDHVNVTAILFALWNASHLMARHIGRKKFRVTKLCSNHTGQFLPEELISFVVSASFDELPESKSKKVASMLKVNSLIHGKLQATFKLGDKMVAEVECKFVGWN